MTPIKTIQPIIDLGLYTVPLNGTQIIRDERGKKKGYSFPSGWQKNHSQKRNETPTLIGGLLTSNTSVIAIDADDTATYNLFKSLDATNTAYFDSIGKLDLKGNPIESGTILYKGDSELMPSFRATNGSALDFYNGTGMVFLPTKANTTKTSWLEHRGSLYNQNKELVVIKDMPQVVRDLLELIKTAPTEQKSIGTTSVARHGKGFIARILENYDLTQATYYPQITKLLTPKEYRSEKYHKQGHLHPNDIVGSGHMYLFKIACILATDNTVDSDLLRDTISYLNDLWETPERPVTIEKTIIGPILKGQKNPNGGDYWQYDENWDNTTGYNVIAKRGSKLLTVFFDSSKKQHYIYDVIDDKIESFQRPRLIEFLRGAIGGVDQKELDLNCDDIHTYSHPTQDFGYFNNDMDFNLFKASRALEILNNPERHEQDYKVPQEFINYMEHFIPSEEQRKYFLRLLRTKMTTFGYSPVVPYIIGVQGSGKNLIMTVIQNIMGGTQYVKTDVGGEIFLEKFNSWLMDTYFVQLNELADTVTTGKEKMKAQGILKNYTGSKYFECRAMGRDAFTHPQTAMFIMTANHSPLTMEDTDRRLFYIHTPNTFDFSPQCLASDPTTVYEAIMAQTEDIAYWLATEFENLKGMDYGRAPDTEGKNQMVFESLNSSSKICWALGNKEFKILHEWLIDPQALFSLNIQGDKLWLEDIVKAYEHHSSTDDPQRALKLAMKAQGFKLYFGTSNKPFYVIPELGDYTNSNLVDDEAEDIDLGVTRT